MEISRKALQVHPERTASLPTDTSNDIQKKHFGQPGKRDSNLLFRRGAQRDSEAHRPQSRLSATWTTTKQRPAEPLSSHAGREWRLRLLEPSATLRIHLESLTLCSGHDGFGRSRSREAARWLLHPGDPVSTSQAGTCAPTSEPRAGIHALRAPRKGCLVVHASATQ